MAQRMCCATSSRLTPADAASSCAKGRLLASTGNCDHSSNAAPALANTGATGACPSDSPRQSWTTTPAHTSGVHRPLSPVPPAAEGAWGRLPGISCGSQAAQSTATK
ncbi:hypothetical protein C1932_10735 [Stenotrophomonas sp. YAU14D1_LEIMI4_1]|nr:hypothetical protein C1932_10735 [Stenotrophomonas sp. YAU14D1_LEIMI4_1]